MENLVVIQGAGKASKWVKVALTDDPQLLAEEISERNPMEFKVKHKEDWPEHIPFDEVETLLQDTAEEFIDGFYMMTTSQVKRVLREVSEDEDRDPVEDWSGHYHDDNRDAEFEGRVIDG
jgi:hypothetical protein